MIHHRKINISELKNVDLSGPSKKSTPEYGESSLNIITEKKMTHEKALRLIKIKLIDLSWAGTNNKLEQELLPIRIPLLQGLLGNRVSIIHKKNLNQ